jgi:hypothetical protein
MNRTTGKNMDNFDWVTERASCSIAKCFELLKQQIKDDAKIRHELRPAGTHYGFAAMVQGGNITVIVEGNSIHETVSFHIAEKGIIVVDRDGKEMFTATPTLNEEGDCKLTVNGELLEYWQVRMMALEDLFFKKY